MRFPVDATNSNGRQRENRENKWIRIKDGEQKYTYSNSGETEHQFLF